MTGKTRQPHMIPHTSEKVSTNHTNKQWNIDVEGGREGKTAKDSKQNAPPLLVVNSVINNAFNLIKHTDTTCEEKIKRC